MKMNWNGMLRRSPGMGNFVNFKWVMMVWRLRFLKMNRGDLVSLMKVQVRLRWQLMRWHGWIRKLCNLSWTGWESWMSSMMLMRTWRKKLRTWLVRDWRFRDERWKRRARLVAREFEMVMQAVPRPLAPQRRWQWWRCLWVWVFYMMSPLHRLMLEMIFFRCPRLQQSHRDPFMGTTT